MTADRATVLALAAAAAWVLQTACAGSPLEVRTVSSRSDAVSGGSALVEVGGPTDANWSVHLDNTDVTSLFHRAQRSGKMLALLSGLSIGKSTLDLSVSGTPRSKMQILNHPIAGPIFSGPHQRPFLCQTELNGLGPALDVDCAAKTSVEYYYKSIGSPQISDRDKFLARYDARLGSTPTLPAPGFKVYDPSGPRPPDLAQTAMSDGRMVDYIVRREIGVINRAVYEIQFLHEPGQPLPTPWTGPTKGWNGRLVYTFGGGCSAGYRQGVLPVYERSDFERILAQGYALATSSLNVLGNNCNDKVSAETASMVKEYFIKQYGEPAYTIGLGGSGGAVSVYLIAQNYPGILDGIIAYLSTPDIITTVIPVFSDCALLQDAFKQSKRSWTEVQKTAISGFVTWQTCTRAALVLSQLGWLDPKRCDSSLPKEMIYDRISNYSGTRCTFYDNAINVLGRDPKTGFARRTLDNVGIQYGLVAFNAGKIDADEFIELNERIGGYDQDGEIVDTRTVADPEGLRIAYQRGVAVVGKSLANVPIIDWNRYVDDLGDFHTRDRAFITRARLIAANGDAGNQAILVTPRPTFDGPTIFDIHDMPGVGLHVLVPQMDLWLASIAADQQNVPLSAKIGRNKPPELADACIAVDGERIVEPATYNGPGRCNQMYPSYGNPRVAAGAPIAGDILKCALKPFGPSDYLRSLTSNQLRRLKVVFSTGVCDYSKPGVGQHTEPTVWYSIKQ